MASGFFALLDDIVALTKLAAASLDDVAAQTIQSSKKAAGIVIDDAAVTPRYAVGLAAERELPVIARIAWGSLKNKLLFLLPGALALSWLAPWAITPLLMAGGLFLCFEGYEKAHALWTHQKPATLPEAASPPGKRSVVDENKQVASAIRTDFILSAEIMAISLATIEAPTFVTKAIILALVGILVTAGVYGVVALIVKADDVGLWLATHGRLAATRAFGRGLIKAMPPFLKILSFVGMLAMLWVGGGIILHGLEEFGLGALPHAIHAAAQAAGSALGPLAAAAGWTIEATAAGVIGLVLGGITERIVRLFISH